METKLATVVRGHDLHFHGLIRIVRLPEHLGDYANML